MASSAMTKGVLAAETRSGVLSISDRHNAELQVPEQLAGRANLLGRDSRLLGLRGGSASSKTSVEGMVRGKRVKLLWVTGRGEELASVERDGLATMYPDLLMALEKWHRRGSSAKAIAGMFPLVTVGENPVPTPVEVLLHAALPAAHVNVLQMDFADEPSVAAFRRATGHKLAWLPWTEPDFTLALALRKLVDEMPGCEGVVLGGYGVVTWGATQQESYSQTVSAVCRLQDFVAARSGAGSLAYEEAV